MYVLAALAAVALVANIILAWVCWRHHGKTLDRVLEELSDTRKSLDTKAANELQHMKHVAQIQEIERKQLKKTLDRAEEIQAHMPTKADRKIRLPDGRVLEPVDIGDF